MSPEPRAVSVVIGVIDDGCALFNSKWSMPSGQSRIVALWDQGQAFAALPWQPTAMGYGRQLLNEGNALDILRRKFEADSADELRWYEQLGYPRSLLGGMPERLHGTHVLDLAAGWPDPLAAFALPGSTADAPLADSAIVFVSLPQLNTEDTTGGSLGLHVLDALRYMVDVRRCLRRLDGRAGAPPLVVNISYGTLAGPHDGSSLIEQAIDDFLEHEPDCAVIIGAGNGRTSQCHARLTLAPGDSATLQWLREPDDATDSFAELSWPATTADTPAGLSLGVSLTLPDQPASPLCKAPVNHWSGSAHGQYVGGHHEPAVMCPTGGPAASPGGSGTDSAARWVGRLLPRACGSSAVEQHEQCSPARVTVGWSAMTRPPEAG